jgi:ribosomal protein S7
LCSIEVKDISLTDYIQVRHAVYLPHTAGRYAKRQFKKAQMPIVERLVDRCGPIVISENSLKLIGYLVGSLMMKGRNNGKKLLAVRIVAHAFEIIHLLSDQNPIQVCAWRLHCETSLDLFMYRFSSMLLSTLVPVKTQPVLAPRVPSVVRPLMSLLFAELTRPSLS